MSNFRVFNSSESLLSRFSQNSLNEGANLSSFQQSLDQSISGFSAQLTDFHTIAPMMAGSASYSLLKSGTLALMGSSLPVRMIAPVLSLAGEVTVFEGANELLHPSSPSPRPSPVEGEGGFWNRWRHSFVSFGLLKLGGHAGANQNLLIQHLMQDSAMVAGHYATAALNLSERPTGSVFEQALQAEMMNIQLGFSMSFAHGLTPRLAGYERILGLMNQTSTVSSRSSVEVQQIEPSSVESNSSSEGMPLQRVRFQNLRNVLRDALLSPMWMMMGAGGIGGGGKGGFPKRGTVEETQKLLSQPLTDLEPTVNRNADPSPLQKVLDRQLSELDLDARSRQALIALGVNYLGQLVQISMQELLKQKNYGRKSLHLLNYFLEKIKVSDGVELSLGMTIQHWTPPNERAKQQSLTSGATTLELRDISIREGVNRVLLRMPASACNKLEALGIKTFGDLIQQDRVQLLQHLTFSEMQMLERHLLAKHGLKLPDSFSKMTHTPVQNEQLEDILSRKISDAFSYGEIRRWIPILEYYNIRHLWQLVQLSEDQLRNLQKAPNRYLSDLLEYLRQHGLSLVNSEKPK